MRTDRAELDRRKDEFRPTARFVAPLVAAALLAVPALFGFLLVRAVLG